MATLSQVTEAVFTSRFDDQTTAGANAAARALDRLGNSVEVVDERLKRSERTAGEWVKKADLVTQAEMRVAKATREVEQARRALATAPDIGDDQKRRTLETLEARLRSATARYDALRGAQQGGAQAASATSEALKLQAHEWTNLIHQFQDFAVQVGSGQGVFRPLLQQAPQATSAVGGVARAFELTMSVLTPFRVAMGAAAAAGAAAALAYNSQEGALSRMQTRLRAVSTDYQTMGRQAEAAARAAALTVPGLSLDTARSAQISLAAAAPRGSGFDVSALTAQAADFAAVMGIDAAAGVERFAQAMRDPVALVDELAKQNFPGMNEQLRLTTQRLMEGGQRADAFALVIGRVNEATKGAARDGLSPFQDAFDQLSKRLRSIGQEIGSFLAEPGRALVEWINRRLGPASEGGMFDPSLGTSTGIGRLTGWEPWGGSRVNPNPVGPSPAEIQQMIREEAARQGVPVDFALRIARGESSYRQFAPDGSVLNNDGALGVFQIRTPAAQDAARALSMSGFDRLTAAGNIRMGVWYAGQRLAAAGGDEREAAFRYNQGDGGYQAALEGRNPRVLAAGRAYQTQFDRPLSAAAQPNASPAQSASPLAAQPASEDVLNRALRLARGEGQVPGQGGTLATQRAGLEDMISLAERAKGLASATAADVDVLTAAQERWRGALHAAREPQAQFIEGLRRSADTANELDPAQRAVNEAVRDYEERMRASGQEPSDAGRVVVRAEKLRELASAYGAASLEAQRSIEGQSRLAQAWGQGSDAVRRLAVEEKAREVVRQSGIRGEAEQAAKVASLANEYERLATIQADNALRASNDAAQRNLDYLDRERELITATADQRERELAAFRARQNAEASGAKDAGAISEAERMARATVDANNRTAQLRNSWQAIPGFVEETASTIKQSLVSAIAAGEQRAINFGNVWRAVKASAIGSLIELGAINPALNYAFGGTRATLGGIGDAISGAGSAAGGAGGGLSGAGDTASGLLKLFRGGSGGAVNTGFSWLDNNLNATAYSVGGTDISVAGAGMGAIGVAGGLYGLYNAGQVGGAKGWAQGIGSTAGILAGAGSMLGWGASAGAIGTGMGALAAVPTTGAIAAGGAAAAGAGAAGGATAAAGAGSAILGGIAAVAPYVAIIAAVAAMFLSGQKPSDMTGVYRGNLHTGENSVGGLSGDRYSQDNRDQASQLGQHIADLSTSLRAAMGVGETPFNYEIALGARDGLAASYGGKTRRYEADEAGSKQMIADITSAMIESMRGLASAEVQSIIANSGSDTEALLGNLDWYNGTYKMLIAQANGTVDAFAQSIEALVKPIDEARTKAVSLGLSEAELIRVREKGIATLIEQRQQTLVSLEAGYAARVAAATGADQSLDYRLGAFNSAAQAEREALYTNLRTQLGLTDEESRPRQLALEEALAAERLKLEKDYYAESLELQRQQRDQAEANVSSALEGISEFVRSMQLGSDSLLSPSARLDLASRQFGQLSGEFGVGDYSRLSDFTSLASAYRTAARDYYGTSAGAADAESRILALAESIAAVPGETLTISAMQAIQDSSTNRLADLLTQLLTETRLSRLQAAGMAGR